MLSLLRSERVTPAAPPALDSKCARLGASVSRFEQTTGTKFSLNANAKSFCTALVWNQVMILILLAKSCNPQKGIFHLVFFNAVNTL